MKYIIICSLVFCGFTSARPQNTNFGLRRYDHFNDGYGNYRYAFQINDDIIFEQNGELKLAEDNTQVTVASGAYTIATPDNVIQEVHYVADENGYRPHVLITKQDAASVNINGAQVKIEKPIKNEFVFPTTAPPNTGATNSKEFQLETSTEAKDSYPQVVAENAKQNNTIQQHANNTIDPEDFPDRIGTPVIISLQGAPG